jgi:hypothetical protein
MRYDQGPRARARAIHDERELPASTVACGSGGAERPNPVGCLMTAQEVSNLLAARNARSVPTSVR